MTTLEVIPKLLGLGAFALGIRNHRNQIQQSAVKLKVLPKLAFPGVMDELISETYFSERVERALGNLKTYACIEVTNQGLRSVNILEVGFVDSLGLNVPWRDPEWIEPQQEFPIELRPNQKTQIYLRLFQGDLKSLGDTCYVKTDCGEVFNATSPIITDALKWVGKCEKHPAASSEN